MSDLIGKQAASIYEVYAGELKRALTSDNITVLRVYGDNGEYAEFTRNTGASPLAPQWIPCSERLPEEGKAVLTQATFRDDVKMAVSSRVDYNYWTAWGTREINIVAWMPLPEPYREGTA